MVQTNQMWEELFYYHLDRVIGTHLPARPSVLRGRATPAHPSAPAERGGKGKSGMRDDEKMKEWDVVCVSETMAGEEAGGEKNETRTGSRVDIW